MRSNTKRLHLKAETVLNLSSLRSVRGGYIAALTGLNDCSARPNGQDGSSGGAQAAPPPPPPVINYNIGFFIG
jgi:hypothetical protein